MDAFLISAAKSVVSIVQEFIGSAGTTLGQAASSPKKAATLLSLFLLAHFFLFTSMFIIMLCFKSGRARIRKYWRISQQGPFYRLFVWIGSLIVRLIVWAGGDKMYTDPKGCKPRFTTIKTQVGRIVLNWTAQPSSKWYSDEYELQILRKVAAAGGKDKSVYEEWETAYKGKEKTCDCDDLEEDAVYKFRVRTFNRVGASEWQEGSFATRQRSSMNGGTGPGYTWTQNTKEIHVVMDVRSDSKSKDFVVECKSTRILVRDTGVTPPVDLIDGELWKSVKGSELSWSLGHNDSKQKQMFVVMEKMDKTQKRKEHWSCVVKGHPMLDSRFLPDCIIPSGKLPDESEI
mmetsp:Transcript_21036/g.51673  ORF Transcript_21036/g.51673 Transcript_21036/m.51673 type:complete len:345 (+) Transcript_21036:68-1102(+)